MPTTIESLELEIQSNSKNAVSGVDALTQSLTKLKNATKGGMGLSSVAKGMTQLSSATSKAASAGGKASGSFTDFFHKLKFGSGIITRAAKTIKGLIDKSSEYNEIVNLFSVSLGEYANEAYDYALKVSDVMGIDTAEWMKNQGVFMTLATGFGVAGDRAYKMSQQLTQLGYDISSFQDISVEEAMQKLQSGLAGELEPLRRIGYDLSQAKLEATAFALGIDKSVSSMTQAEKAQLRYYAIMTQVTQQQGDMAKTLDQPANQMRVFKAQIEMAARSLGNIFIPALNAILPVATAVVKVIRGVADTIAGLFGYEFPEVDYSGVSAMSGAAESTSDAMDDATKSAKKLKSYMLGFDELNVINPDEGGSSSAVSSSDGFDFELPEYDFLAGAVESKVESIVKTIEGSLAEIELIAAGASLALGAILTFSGVNIPLGIALMAGGALGLAAAIATNWDSIKTLMEGKVGAVTAIIGGASLAIGGLLAFSGVNIPLGIALMMVGAAGLATTVAANWDSVSEALQGPVGAVTGIISGGLLAIGAMFAFSGVNIALGIALMMAGAAGLTTVLALNWSSVKDALTGPIGDVTGIVSVAVLALGAILAFSGAALPLGIALMLLGAGGLATVITANWDSVKQTLEGPVGAVTALISGAVLGLGAILAFSGANIPLGIALMLLGAAGLATAITANWDSLSDALGGPVGTITTIVSGALIALGAILAFSGAGTMLGISLMLAGAAGLVTMTALNWDSLTEALTGPVGKVTAMISGAMLALGALLAFSGAGVGLGVSLMLLGAAGLATTAALNWDGVKSALQGPVGKVTALISGAALALGAILCFTMVAMPLGIALMLAGAAGLTTVAVLNWDGIKDKIDGVIKGILKILSGAMLALGILLCLSGAGIGLGLALIFGALKVSNKAWETDDNPITQFVKKMVNGIVKIINWAIDGINEMFHIEFSGLTIAGVEIIPAFNKRLINIPKIPMMAEGGFPEQGQMFIAREAGAEMVGNIGRKTAVVNNEQIVASISGGVAEANEEQNALLREQNDLLRALLDKESGVYLDGKHLTNSVEKYQRERGRVLITGGVV